MPLLGWKITEICCINEEFEYFQENIVREGADCHLLVKVAYTVRTSKLAITLLLSR